MCGRYASTRPAFDLADLYKVDAPMVDEELTPSWNVCPTDGTYTVLSAPDGTRRRRQLRVTRWGLVPWFMKDSRGAAGKINARAETLTTTPAFRQAAAQRRALIPMDGWYEWRPHPNGPGKQPYFLTSEIPLTAAGLWERWRGPDGAELLTCAIVTTAAVGPLVDIHDRMPLLVPADRWDDWLDPTRRDPAGLLTPDTHLIAGLELRPVGPGIGDVRNKTSPNLVARIDL